MLFAMDEVVVNLVSHVGNANVFLEDDSIYHVIS